MMDIKSAIYKLIETMDVAFDLEWHRVWNYNGASKTINGKMYILEIEDCVVSNFKIGNARFGIYNDQTKQVEYQLSSVKNPFIVLAGIGQALYKKIKEDNYDVVYFIAADNVQKRMDVYLPMANRIAKSFGNIVPDIKLNSDELVTVVLKHGLSNNEEFMELLIAEIEHKV